MLRATPAYQRVSEEKQQIGLIGFDLFHGNRFRVGPGGYRVRALGYSVQIGLPSPRVVILFDEEDGIVAQADLCAEDYDDGWDRWREIPPVDLAPGMTYTLTGFVTRGAVDLYDEGVAKLAEGLEDLGSWYAAGSSLEGRCGWESSGGYRQYVANMRGGPVSTLSARHRELIDLASQGLTDKEIASKLGIGVQTIDTYWKRLRDFYDANNRTEVVARSLQDLYRQAHRSLSAERERLLKVERDRGPKDEARRRGEIAALEELGRLRLENARLQGENRRLKSALADIEATGVVFYDEENRTCTDSVTLLGIDPEAFRNGRDSITGRILPEDQRRVEGNARMRTFRVQMADGNLRWVLELRGGGSAACALPLDLLDQIEVADQERFFKYVGESALAMWRRPAITERSKVEGYRFESPFEPRQ